MKSNKSKKKMKSNGSVKKLAAKVCNFFADFFNEEDHGQKRLSATRLENEYDVSTYFRRKLVSGDDMMSSNMTKVGRAYLLQFPTQKERFVQIIKLLDLQREQDIANYGPEWSPFQTSFKEMIHQYVLEEAEQLLEERDPKEHLTKIFQELIENGQLKK